MNPPDSVALLLPTLLARLERISADSHWAHRASGLRGALIRLQDRIESGRPVDATHLQRSMEHGFKILEGAAREKAGAGKP